LEKLKSGLRKHIDKEGLGNLEIAEMEEFTIADFAQVELDSGLSEPFPLDEGWELILNNWNGAGKIKVYGCGEDWVVFHNKGEKIEAYWVDNWEFIKDGLESLEPLETLSE